MSSITSIQGDEYNRVVILPIGGISEFVGMRVEVTGRVTFAAVRGPRVET